MALCRLQPFEVTLCSSELSVRDALKKILVKLKPLDLDTTEANAVELVLAEVLNNIVEHAYPETERSGIIKVSCAQQTDGLNVKVSDWGAAMPDGQLPIGTLAHNTVLNANLPEGGFGWFIIRHLAKDVIYKRKGGENRLSLRMAIGLPN